MARAFRLRGGAGNGLGGGKVRRDGSQRAASLGFDPQHFGFYLNILAGGEPCELRAAPVDMGAVDQLALFRRGVDGCADLRVTDPAQPDPSGFFLQGGGGKHRLPFRSEEHTSELQSLMRISYAVFCLKKKKKAKKNKNKHTTTKER